MEQVLGSYPVRSKISGIQEVHEQIDGHEGEYGEVRAIAGEGDGQGLGEDHDRPRFPGPPNSKVSGPMKWSVVILPAVLRSAIRHLFHHSVV